MSLPRLRHNIFALGVVQAGNFLAPLLVLPYLARTLGAEAYGHMVWVQTIMLLGRVWVDFSFGWTTSREISAHRDDRAIVSRLFVDTWSLQWVLGFVFVLLLLGWMAFNTDAIAIHYWAGLGLALAPAFFPLWLFQGLENLRAVAIIQLSGKLLVIPLAFLWVKDSRDLVWALLFFSVSAVLPGIMSVAWIVQRNAVIWVRPDPAGMWLVFKNSIAVFLSRATISVNSILVPLAVGWWGGATQLAYFNLADKFRTVVQSLLTTVSQALFPRMSWLAVNDPSGARALLKKAALAMTGVSLVMGFVLSQWAQPLMLLMGGAEFHEGAAVLRWMAWLPLFVALSSLMGEQIMLPHGMSRPFSIIYLMAFVLTVLLLQPMVHRFAALGAAQFLLLVELSVALVMGICLKNFWQKRGHS